MPQVVSTVAELRRAVADAKGRGLRVGLVPTMGALHAGHASLLRQARGECGFVVASIFVNPTQFGPNEDFHRYPRPFDADLALCAAEATDVVFHPTPAEMYPPGHQTFVEVTEVQKPLCGTSRPGHFRGVATVVLKLFNQAQPDRAYFGQKDAQQVRLIERMVADLDVPIAIVVCPIVREPDGLALSSRNRYLSPEDRAKAPALHRALDLVRRRVEAGQRDVASLRAEALDQLSETPGLRVDYFEIVSWETLTPQPTLEGETLVAVAAFLGTTRLIDNLRLRLAT